MSICSPGRWYALLAHDAGAGKTIMAGLTIKELKRRHGVRRILIVAPGQAERLAQASYLPSSARTSRSLTGLATHEDLDTGRVADN